MTVDTLILGAGLSGISASYHIGHNRCLILEAKNHPYGHIHSEIRDGFTWDEGPHVSFTSNEYVQSLFANGVEGAFEEFEVRAGNYYQGSWINHPAQSNLYQVPEPLRGKCLQSFLGSREKYQNASLPGNYQEWLYQAFGEEFSETFSAPYTRKYWTVNPDALTTEWIGPRLFKPSVEDVLEGSVKALSKETHYIKNVRYPSNGGYQSFARKILQESQIRLDSRVCKVDLGDKKALTADGNTVSFRRLISTIPLPDFVRMCPDLPAAALDAAKELLCSSMLLVNVAVPHPTLRRENWMYVYDEGKYSTRINCTERLSHNNAPRGHSGVQVEVYHSRMKPLAQSESQIVETVLDELVEMGLIDLDLAGGRKNIRTHTKRVPWANIVYHHATKEALGVVLSSLEAFGLNREVDDLHPLTSWAAHHDVSIGDLVLAGRYAQWKYFWTDDCVLRGKQLGEMAHV